MVRGIHEPAAPTVHRDATFGRQHRDLLERAAEVMRSGIVPRRDERQLLAQAIENVVERWDENEATEILVYPEGVH